MKTLCFTGHRKIPGKGYEASWNHIKQVLINLINTAYPKGFRKFYCGGAIGFDTAAAEAVLHMKQVYPDIQLIMAIPCKCQPNVWPAYQQKIYHDVLGHADTVVYVDKVLNMENPGNYNPAKMLARNQYMLDHSQAVIAYTDGKTTGGTAHCIGKALGMKLPVLTINAHTLTTDWKIP